MAGAYEKVCAVRLEPEGSSVRLADKLFGFVMGTNSRKLIIGFISLAVVLAVFLLYNLMSETPPIDIDRGAELAKEVADSNAAEFDREVGKIADVGVGTVRKAKYTHLNAQKQLDREFGFEKLLHEQADQWEIEKPYMNIFRRNFKCYITADKGTVQIEDALGRATPKDATLTGNVVIHILPETATGVKESFVYLDDVVYISERSQFSTAGPVKFVSPDAQMLGTGMEFVYNDELNRLEFLRIVHLEDLRIRTSSKASLLGSQQTEPPAEPVAGDVTQKQKQTQDLSTEPVERKSGVHYRCFFDKNVVVNTPRQTVLTDRLSINNISLSKASSDKGTKADKTPPDTSGTLTRAADESTEEFVDVTVTCDGGILVTPMGSPAALESSIKVEPRPALTNNQVTESPNDTTDRTKFVAQRINYCAAAGDTVASGPSELTFYVNDLIDRQAAQAPVPVKVTAQKQAQFQPAANQVIFEGDCVCTMTRTDPNIRQEYSLAAPKITVDLAEDKTRQSGGPAAAIEHVTADGGVVQLAAVKETEEEELLGFTKLKCRRFDYDSSEQMCMATGPDGLIAADNSKIQEPKEKVSKFALRRQCSAVLRGFDTMEYYLESNQIIADAEKEGIIIDYFPVVKGQYGPRTTLTTSHIEAPLYETPAGQIELASLSATGGFTYEEEDIEFQGSRAFYDAGKSLITAQGDGLQPCYLNGALVDVVRYNLKTGRVKTKITGPGFLHFGK